MTHAAESASFSIIALDTFIRATRDSGYKGTPSAVAELVDNALQAGAKRVEINVLDAGLDERHPLRVTVKDDGAGMDPVTLRTALRFGGSTRFNDRKGIGRFGMGLPNSSFSQARHVSVYSWRAPGEVYHSWLDVDLIAAGEMTEVPTPVACEAEGAGDSPSGTMVVWSQCDRLDNKRPTTVARKLRASLGRRFRYYIWGGVELVVNGRAVPAIDPLYLREDSVFSGAELFGEPIKYELAAPSEGGPPKIGRVTVRFAELPVHEWHGLPNEEKRRRGVSKGAGVSVVRGDREVDYGWFFMGRKRRENYDDWWRCEVRFDPVLDELFGITHTKQQVRPHAKLIEVLVPDLEQLARALNSRARQAHLNIKVARRAAPSASVADRTEAALAPLPAASDGDALRRLEERLPHLRRAEQADGVARVSYAIAQASVPDRAFFGHARDDARLVLTVSPEHPFFKQVYKPLTEADDERSKQVRRGLELALLSAARAEAAATGPQAEAIRAFRQAWGDTLAAYLCRTP